MKLSEHDCLGSPVFETQCEVHGVMCIGPNSILSIALVHIHNNYNNFSCFLSMYLIYDVYHQINT